MNASSKTPRLSICLLGPMQVTLDGNPVTAWKSDRAQALLAYLAVEAERPQRRERLAGLLWPEVPERVARTNLRRALADLRQALGDHRARPPFLHTTRQTIQFNRASDAWVDLTAFTRLCETASLNPSASLLGEASSLGEVSDRSPVPHLEQALRLVRGAFLEGFSLPGSPAFEEWALLQGEQLRRAILLARGHLADHYAEREDYERALLHARHAVDLEPWEEQAQRRLMRLLALSGQRGAALAQYQACHHALAEELGVEPQAETTALYQQILSGAFGARQRQRAALLHRLPAPLTAFVGRSEELKQVQGRLRDPDCRLLTLVGPGGIGKSRLAIQVARELVSGVSGWTVFPQGVYYVPLVALDDAQGLVPSIATALDFQFSGEDDVSPGGHEPRQPREQLLNYLRRRKLLLVLDNFEQLLDPGAGESHAADGATGLVVALLRTAPGVKLLITSRATLQLQAEWIYPLSGMAYPTDDEVEPGREQPDLEEYAAMVLLAQAARRACPGFSVAREREALLRICRLVEGVPLALELAAAGLKTLPASRVADEIERGLGILSSRWQDVEPRHRSMRAVFDHSWKLLPPAERMVLGRLAVLRGGFGPSAAAAVAGASTPLLAGLVERSLLRLAPGGRYHMHELLRQYALERLGEDGREETATRERHSAYYARLLQECGQALQGGGQQAALAELDLEIENARAAWDWAVARGEVERLDRALEGLCMFYAERHRPAEGEAACRLAATRLQVIARDTELRPLARVLAWQAAFSRWLEPVENAGLARQLLAQSLELLERPELAVHDTRQERAFVLRQMGRAKYGADFQAAQHWYQQSLDLYRALGESWWTADTLFSLSDVTALLGQFDQAKGLLVESLEMRRALGDRRGIAQSLSFLSLFAAHSEPSQAGGFGRESITILRESGDQAGLAGALYCVGLGVAVSGNFAEGYALLEESVAIYDDLGNDRDAAWSGEWSALVALHLGQYHRAQRGAEKTLEFFREKNALFEIGCSLSVLGMAALARAAPAEAVEILKESVNLFRQVKSPDPLSRDLSNLGLAVLGLGDVARAQRHLAEALRLAHRIQLLYTILSALAATVPLLAALGRPERAVALYALASRYPFVANSRWFQEVVGRPVAAVAAGLPAHVVAAAQERGCAWDPWAATEELQGAL